MSAEASCHCGAVRLVCQTAPVELNDCQCSICRRYHALWAYYTLAEVQITGETDIYMWNDRMLEFHRCRTCGCVTHWYPADHVYPRMGVNARLMAPEVVAAARVMSSGGPD